MMIITKNHQINDVHTCLQILPLVCSTCKGEFFFPQVLVRIILRPDKVDTVVTKFAGKNNHKLRNGHGCRGTIIVIYWSKEKVDKIYNEACLT